MTPIPTIEVCAFCARNLDDTLSIVDRYTLVGPILADNCDICYSRVRCATVILAA